jgi:hypothetical protein
MPLTIIRLPDKAPRRQMKNWKKKVDPAVKARNRRPRLKRVLRRALTKGLRRKSRIL